MNRRNFIVGAGSIGAATIGGAALLGGSAAAMEGGLSITDPDTVSVDDGSYQYVAIGLSSVHEWQGLDSEATHAHFVAEIRLPESPDEEEQQWHELYNEAIPLADLGDTRGGSLEWTTGEGTTGVLHTGVGDGPNLLDDYDFSRHSWSDVEDGYNQVEGQGAENRWPVLVSEDYDGDLYGVPDPLYTNTPEVDTDGEEAGTVVDYRKTVVVYNDAEFTYDHSAPNYEASAHAAGTQLEDKFTVTIDNIESESTSGGEGDASTATDESKTA